MLSGNSRYLGIDAELKEKRADIRADIEIGEEGKEMEYRKRLYRGIDKK